MSHLSFSPSEATAGLPAVPGEGSEIPWDSLRIQADDGRSTFLLISRLDEPIGGRWAIFFHGNAMLVSGSGGRYELLRDAGFHVLAVEFRGYGASISVGPPTEEGVYRDAMAGWTYLTETLGVASDSIVVYGFSLGSGLATYVAAQTHLAGVITEGAFTSIPDLGVARYPWLPIRLVARNRFENLQRAKSISDPWLIFHGLNDRVIPFSHSEALAGAARDAQVVPLEAGHDGGVTAEREVALEALQDFARDVFGDAGG